MNLIIKPLWILLIDKEAQNLLGPAYAEYYVVLSLSLILFVVLDIGIQSFNNASVAADAQFFKLNFKSIVFAKLLLSCLFLLLMLIIGAQSNLAFNLLLIVGFNQVLTSLILYLRTNINGLHYYTQDGILSVSDKFFGIIICLALYFFNQISVIWFASAQLIASSITFIFALVLNLKYYKNIPLLKTDALKHKFILLLKKSIPYALLFTLMGMYTRGDVLMMKWLLKSEAVLHTNIYAQCYRLLDAAAMFAMLFAGLLLPMFSKMLSNNQDVRPLSSLANNILLPIALASGVAAYFFSEDILYALYDVYSNGADIEQLRYASNVFTNILWCFIPMCITFVFSTLLTAKRDLKFLNVFACIALLTNFFLNLFFIPEFKSFGASISSLTTQSVFAVLCLSRCFYLFKFKLIVTELFKYIAFIVSLIGIGFLISGFDNILLALSLFAILSVILLFLLQIFKVSHFLKLFNKGTQ